MSVARVEERESTAPTETRRITRGEGEAAGEGVVGLGESEFAGLGGGADGVVELAVLGEGSGESDIAGCNIDLILGKVPSDQ